MAADLLALAATLAAFATTSNDYPYSGAPTLDLVELAEDRWWGPSGQQGKQDTTIHNYTVRYTDEMIADLKSRLNATRYNYKPLENIAFQYGFNHLTLSNWTDYWLNKYDFKKQEALWNKYPAYKTNIQGIDMVYFRVTPKVDNNTELVPLLIQHGWPGSPHEFWQAAELLTAVSPDRKFAIDLILPCLPGFGFSQAAAQPGLGAAQTAVVLRNLMHRIGYKKFYVQGGDFGALTLNNMVTRFPDEVQGYHANWGVVLSPIAILLQIMGALYPPLVVSNATQARMYPIETRFSALNTAAGYLHLQSTRPDTIGVSLTDSPIGLAAYVLEKYATANNKSNYLLVDGGLLNSYTADYLIDNIMYFWSTKSMPTAMRYYAEFFNQKQMALRMDQIAVHCPLALLQATDEFTYQSPTILSLKYKNIVTINDQIKGGHFIAYQHPDLFAQDVLGAITKFRELAAAKS